MQRIADYDASDLLVNRYVYGAELDEPVWAESSSGVITYLHADKTGSIIMTSNQTGGVVNQNSYTPWGESALVNSTNFGFTGQRFDSEVGLYYYKARYFSPKVGRFLQPDAIGYASGDLNLYSYVNNDPLNLSDPLGLKTEVYVSYKTFYGLPGYHTSIVILDPNNDGDYSDSYTIAAGTPDKTGLLTRYEGVYAVNDYLGQLKRRDHWVPV